MKGNVWPFSDLFVLAKYVFIKLLFIFFKSWEGFGHKLGFNKKTIFETNLSKMIIKKGKTNERIQYNNLMGKIKI